MVNASSEEAIRLFREERCSFFGMSDIVLDAYHKFRDVKPYNIEDIIAIDGEVRGYIKASRRYHL